MKVIDVLRSLDEIIAFCDNGAHLHSLEFAKKAIFLQETGFCCGIRENFLAGTNHSVPEKVYVAFIEYCDGNYHCEFIQKSKTFLIKSNIDNFNEFKFNFEFSSIQEFQIKIEKEFYNEFVKSLESVK